MTTSLAIEPSDPLIGHRIDGRYLVQNVLGRGGMGVVYAGVHEHLGREVAIKVLSAGIANDPVAVQRFLREARTASRLTHGNIVDVSDLGTLPDGRPYLVMSRLHGEDLCSLLQRRGPQPPERTVQLLRGAAAALDLIHAKGFLHRDVKPENLMHVVREDGSEAVLLLDFGIVGLKAPESTRLTAAGVLFGTPVYIAPEVIGGQPPSAVSDVYALATVAFELMTGAPPFGFPNLFDLLQAKVTQAAPRLGDIATFQFPESVERVIAVGLEREPARRHASAGAFVEALDAAVRSCPPDDLLRITAGLEAITHTRRRALTDHGERLVTESMEPGLAPISIEPAAARVEPGPTEPLAPASLAPSAPPPQATHVVVAPRFIDRHWMKLAAATGVVVAGVLGARMVLPGDDAPSHAVQEHAPEPPPPPAATPNEPSAAAPATPAAAPAPEPVVQPMAASAAAHKPQPTQPAARKPPEPNDARKLGSSALVQQAQAELVQGHLAAAAQLYERAAQLDPHNAAAFRGLGLTEERLGHVNEAVRSLRRALALAPREPTNALIEQRLRKLEAARAH